MKILQDSALVSNMEAPTSVKREILPLHWTLLAALVVFHVVFLEIWLRFDTRPPAWDESHHLRIALDYRDSFSKGDWGRIFRPAYSNYPPLYHISLSVLVRPVGDATTNGTADQAVRVNILYWTAFLGALFALGMRLGSPTTGLVSATIGSFYGGMLFLFRRPMIDVPLTAWVTLFLVGIVWRREMKHPLWGIFLGWVAAGGMLTKWSFIVYVGAPAAFAIWRDLKDGRHRKVLGFFAALIVVAGPWYLFNLIPSLIRIGKLSSLREAGDPNIWTFAGWTWYLRGGILNHVFWPMAIPVAVGIIEAFRRRRIELLLWLIVPVVAFSLIRNKDLRYILPCLPAAALLSALGANLFKRKVAAGWLAACVCASVLLGVYFSFQSNAPGFWRFLGPAVGRDVPRSDDWKTDEILKSLSQGSGPTRVQLIGNHPYFHADLFRLSAKVNEQDDVYIAAPKRNLGDFADFILWKNENLGPAYTLGYIAEAAALLKEPPLWLEKTFSVDRTWPLPDGSSAVLWVRNVQDAPWPGELGEVDLRLEKFPLPRFEAQGLRVRLKPASAGAARRGTFEQVRIECERLDYRGLILDNVVLDARNVQVDLFRLLDQKEVHFLELGEVRPSVEVGSEVLEDYLRRKVRWLSEPRVTLADQIEVEGRVKGLPIKVKANAVLSSDRSAVDLSLQLLKIGGVSMPLFLMRNYARRTFLLSATKDMPFPVRLSGLEIGNGRIRVTGL